MAFSAVLGGLCGAGLWSAWTTATADIVSLDSDEAIRTAPETTPDFAAVPIAETEAEVAALRARAEQDAAHIRAEAEADAQAARAAAEQDRTEAAAKLTAAQDEALALVADAQSRVDTMIETSRVKAETDAKAAVAHLTAQVTELTEAREAAKTHLGDLRVRIDKALTTAESPVPGGGGDA